MKLTASSILLFLALSLSGQPSILIDDDFADWQNIPLTYADTDGDNGFSNIDFGKLWLYNDADYLFFNIEVGDQINLQEFNEIAVYIDTDNNETTGVSIHGIGADLQYTFGNRSGTVYVGNESQTVYHNNLGLVSSPTVTSEQFELAISRDLVFFGQDLFQGDTIQIVFKNNTGNWDILPDEIGGVTFTYVDEIIDALPEYSIAKPEPALLRFLSYNVLSDGLFDFARAPSMSRLIQAIMPDIIGFQEIYDHGSFEVANKIESILPTGPNAQWYHAKEGPDIIAISKYPITSSFAIDNNGAFLIDLGPDYETELLFIVAHLPCCGNNVDRQLEIDAIMAFVRDAKAGNGTLQLQENTPIIIVGDMNFVGYQQQLTTLLTGNIINENIYGTDFNPDWDESALRDSRPYTTGLPMNFTWFDEGSSFGPGRLDFIAYSGSVLELTNNYTLFTRTLPQDTLSEYNLLEHDAVIASDHLPVVSDFFLISITGVENTAGQPAEDFFFQQNEPNPFSQITSIKYHLPKNSFVTLSVYTMVGKKVADLVNENQNAGTYSCDLNANGWVDGVYFVKITAGEFSATKKIMLLR